VILGRKIISHGIGNLAKQPVNKKTPQINDLRGF